MTIVSAEIYAEYALSRWQLHVLLCKSQKGVIVDFSSKQLLPFGFA